jgi:hypothetical protein
LVVLPWTSAVLETLLLLVMALGRAQKRRLRDQRHYCPPKTAARHATRSAQTREQRLGQHHAVAEGDTLFNRLSCVEEQPQRAKRSARQFILSTAASAQRGNHQGTWRSAHEVSTPLLRTLARSDRPSAMSCHSLETIFAHRAAINFNLGVSHTE